MTCLPCDIIEQIKRSEDPYFVRELETGYVVMSWFQFYKGMALFIAKDHVTELHQLATERKKLFLYEMSIVAEAVQRAFKPVKLNYELLGNAHPHLHWHVVPRHADDPLPNRPIWVIEKEIREADSARPSAEELKLLKSMLNKELEILLSKALV